MAPPSVVRTQVPRDPLTQTTRSLTGLTAISSDVVPLTCSVRVICVELGVPLGAPAQANAASTARGKTTARREIDAGRES